MNYIVYDIVDVILDIEDAGGGVGWDSSCWCGGGEGEGDGGEEEMGGRELHFDVEVVGCGILLWVLRVARRSCNWWY